MQVMESIIEKKEIRSKKLESGRETDLYSPPEGIQNYGSDAYGHSIRDIVEKRLEFQSWENQKL